MQDISYLSQQFFSKPFEDVTIDEIKASIKVFPYFDLLYFFSMLKETDIETISKLSLLTFNPLVAFHKATVSQKEIIEQKRTEKTEVLPIAPLDVAEAFTPVAKTVSAFSVEKVQKTQKLGAVTDTNVKDVITVEKSKAEEIKKEINAPLSTEAVTDTNVKDVITVEKSKAKEVKKQTDTSPSTDLASTVNNKTHSESLNSFLGWLSVMNTFSPQEHAQQLSNIKVQNEVVKSSKASIDPHEIITESMAKVWVEQGMPNKAREVYQKLSLLFPDKLTYFADKLSALSEREDTK